MFLILVFTAFLLTSIAQAYATPLELSHDDGGSNYGWNDFCPMAAAVKFSPPSAGWRIKSIRVHAVCSLRGYANFYIQIWGSSLNTVYWSTFTFNQVFKDNVLDWYTIELPNILVAGEFYVMIIPMFTLGVPGSG